MSVSSRQELDLPPLLVQILNKRGMDEAAMDAFLRPDYDRHLHDPMQLSGMKEAVERIVTAIWKNEEIAVYGDYDIDGLTATALLTEALRQRGGRVRSYIPDRFEEGYGLNQAALQGLKRQGVQLVVTVDCGVTAVGEAAWAKKNGLDLIITDHHTPPEVLPEAVALINPKLPGDRYPFKELAGVGVAFKLVQALMTRLPSLPQGQEKWLLDLVALGTVCDVVPLVGENRALTHFGLKVLAKTRRPGLAALMRVGGVEAAALTSFHLGFVLGPRLNASGRLKNAAKSLAIIESASQEEAIRLAEELDGLNRRRQKEQAEILSAAQLKAREREEPVLVLADEAWSHGIVGIVASKLAERTKKPVFLLQDLGDELKGSARSYGGFNVIAALRESDELLKRYGGHHHAAGLTINKENLQLLRERLADSWRRQDLPTDFAPYQTDAEVTDPSVLDRRFYAQLSRLEPFGHGNPVPVLSSRLIVKEARAVGADLSHLKLRLSSATGQVFDAIGFGLSDRKVQTGQTVEAVYQLKENHFNGRTTIQLSLVDIK